MLNISSDGQLTALQADPFLPDSCNYLEVSYCL